MLLIEGQGRIIEPGCSYLVKDEVWIGLCGSTTVIIMEEGEQRGICRKRTQEWRDRILAEEQSRKKLKKSKCVPSLTFECQLVPCLAEHEGMVSDD